jgi:hypothetical protein
VRIVAWALLALAVAGCGGSGSSRDDFTIEANAVCAAADARTADLGARPPPMTPEYAAWVEQLLDVAREAVASLRELEPPPDGRRLIDEMLGGFERGLRHGQAVPAAVRTRDAATFATAVEAAAEQLAGARLAAAGYGLDACARLAGALR